MTERENDSSESTLLVTERSTPEGLLVSVCDAHLIGETFANHDLSLTVTEEFYGGDPADEASVVESLGKCDTANLVGHTAVAIAIENGFVEEENVLDIDGTRHAQLLWM